MDDLTRTTKGWNDSAVAISGLRRLRTLSWDEAITVPIPPSLEGEMAGALDGQIVRLIGHPPRSERFLAQTLRLLAPGGSR